VDLTNSLIDLLGSHLQLVVERIGTVNQRLPFLVQYVDSGVLCKTLLLPLGESAVTLIDVALLPLSQLLLLKDGQS
jgi:hypothetical protein